MKKLTTNKTTKKLPIVILHGWSREMSGQKYSELKSLLEQQGHTVFSPDLPGFGSEPLKKSAMNLDDYVEFVRIFLEKHKIKQVILIGHSFGGRISTKLAYKYPQYVKKIILTGAPLIREPLSAKKKVLSVVAKIGKGLLSTAPEKIQNISKKVLYHSIGEQDYFKSGNLRETFKNIVNEDLVDIIPKIEIPTLLVWGENDRFVPVWIGERIGKLLKTSEIRIISGTHRLPYENPKLFQETIHKFIS